MAKDMWLPTEAELRRQCAAKLLEAEKDYWITTNEMLHGMLEEIWDAAKKGETITLRRNGQTVTVASPDGRGEA